MKKKLKFFVPALLMIFIIAYILPLPIAGEPASPGFVLLSPGKDGAIGTDDDIYTTAKGETVKGAIPSDWQLTELVPSAQGQEQQVLNIALNADKTEIGTNEPLTITVSVTDKEGNPVDTEVTFSTTLGDVTPETVTTENGQGTAVLACASAGTAIVTASAGSYKGTIEITVTEGGDWVQIAGGGHHSLALRNDGTVWAWGRNNYGQLGDGTTTERHTPVQVANLTGVQAIAGGFSHSLALRSDGTVWAWGRNSKGQLGDGTTTNRTTPVQVLNLTGVQAIAGGFFHSLALKSDGTVWAWGYNHFGQLGDGTTANRTIPVQVADLTGVQAIAAGSDHSLALRNDGTVWAWGWNYLGQLGDGTTANRSIPVQVQLP